MIEVQPSAPPLLHSHRKCAPAASFRVYGENECARQRSESLIKLRGSRFRATAKVRRRCSTRRNMSTTSHEREAVSGPRLPMKSACDPHRCLLSFDRRWRAVAHSLNEILLTGVDRGRDLNNWPRARPEAADRRRIAASAGLDLSHQIDVSWRSSVGDRLPRLSARGGVWGQAVRHSGRRGPPGRREGAHTGRMRRQRSPADIGVQNGAVIWTGTNDSDK